MKLFLIWQNEINDYDTYENAVVAAKNETEAKNTHPSGISDRWNSNWDDWARTPSTVFAKEIGLAKKGTDPGVICASYRAW